MLAVTLMLVAMAVGCNGILPDLPSSYFQADRLLNGRKDTPHPPSSTEEKKKALAYVRSLNYIPQVYPHTTQTQYFQGDIILHSIEELNELLTTSSQGRVRRVAPHTKNVWPNGRIPYAISQKFNQMKKDIVLGAIEEINQRIPCLNLVDREGDEHYLHILNDNTGGCWSYVGTYGKYGNHGGNDLNLADGCLISEANPAGFIGTIIHELMHAAGFWHEQSRPDRDLHVTIVTSSIQEEKKHNFDKHTKHHLELPYDFQSLMHYRDTAFNKREGLKTIQAIDDKIKITGQKHHMEPLDVLGLKLLYKCGEDSYPKNEGCNDVHPLCQYWKSKDGCNKFPKYMKAACCRSCTDCVFPFTSKGVEYNECYPGSVHKYWNVQPWCATSLQSDGKNVDSWKWCYLEHNGGCDC